MDNFVQRRPAHGPRQPLALASSNSGLPQMSERPVKRPRLDEVGDSDEDGESEPSFHSRENSPSQAERPLLKREATAGTEPDAEVDEDEASKPHRQTLFESSLLPVKTDKDAIQEYETMRASQLEAEAADDASSRLDKRKWVRGKSSIYVDAFNLALDTVLEDEANLFDTKERYVFETWRRLDYESQYLYVRLFLRKTATWHRIEKLGYYNDISDMSNAIAALLEKHELQELDSASDRDDGSSRLVQPWHLNDSFAFFDDSYECITTMEEAVSLLSLDELKTMSKEAKVQGKNKGDLVKALCRMSAQQSGLVAVGLRRSSTRGSINSNNGSPERRSSTPSADSNRNSHFLTKILAVTGPLIRVSESVFKLFERVHLVFYRSTEWTEKSLTTIILAKISRRNFPDYIVCRSTDIFPSRRHLLEFEDSMRQEFEVDKILEFNGPPGEDGFNKVLAIFESLSTRWRELLREEQRKEDEVYEFGEGGYMRRFNAAHAYTRIAHKAAYVLGRLHKYQQEHSLMVELLDQHLFHPARRGSWYQRKALLEEHYMWEATPVPSISDPEQQKKHWRRVAVVTCEAALEDRDCHLIYHYDLQKRLVKLEKRLKIPRRLQHDFGHVKLRQPEEHTVSGIQLKRDDDAIPKKPGTMAKALSTKTVWLDELAADPADVNNEVSVEEMCLSWYRTQGWKGYHSEGGILRTLFAYLFFDVLFVYVPNVFQTSYQTCPLDLFTDAFYPTRASEINHRLVEIANGGAEVIIRRVDSTEREKRTCVIGLNWDYDLEDLVELVNAFEGSALAAVCKVMAQDYKSRGSGVPDLVLWRTAEESNDGGDKNRQLGGCGPEGTGRARGEVLFSEVKSANDRLSDTQRLWIHVLTSAGVRVALCSAVAREVRVVN